MAIYLLYDCNDWRNQSSMDATSPIAVSTSNLLKIIEKEVEGEE